MVRPTRIMSIICLCRSCLPHNLVVRNHAAGSGNASDFRTAVVFAAQQHRPDATLHLVGQRRGGQHRGLAFDQARQPAIARCAMEQRPPDDGHCAGDQQAANVALAHLRGFPEHLRATGQSLSRHQPKSGRKVSAAFEVHYGRCKGLGGQGADRAHTRQGLQAAGCLALPGDCGDPLLHSIYPAAQVHDLGQHLATDFRGERWQIRVPIFKDGTEAW